MDIHTN